MPISPTKRIEFRRRDDGLTLVEMLVVLAIMGLVSTAAVLGLGGMGKAGGPEAEARLFAQRLQLAADEAMVTDRPVTLLWNDRGYVFSGLPDSEELVERRNMRSAVTLSIPGRDDAIPITGDGSGRAFEAALSEGAVRWSVRFDGLDVAVQPAGHEP